jgi:putative ABC transport system ATP-binding protein
VIKVVNLTKVYGHGSVAVHALKGVNLKIENGEFVAVMGRSGSGKSTLLRLLGLLDAPTDGEIYIENADIGKLPEAQKAAFRLGKLGYVFQEYSLIDELTILQNVYLPSMCASQRNGNNYKKRAGELLATVGLGERLNHYPREVSGGEQQRVAIARSLMNNPRILFADEPTASLDAFSSRIVLELFTRLNKELGQTIVMVTHEPEDEKYVDRVITLSDGLIEAGQKTR